MSVLTVIQLKHSEGKSQESTKGQIQRKRKGHSIYDRKSFCGIDSFLSGCKRGNEKSKSIEHVSITLRFFKKRKKKKEKDKYCIAVSQRPHDQPGTFRFFPSWFPSASSCRLDDLRWLTHPRCVPQPLWAARVSAQIGRQEKSLFDEASEGWQHLAGGRAAPRCADA